jgi:hypothetical protein
MTFSRVLALAFGSPFSTRETVLMETPAALATSWMVGLLTAAPVFLD